MQLNDILNHLLRYLNLWAIQHGKFIIQEALYVESYVISHWETINVFLSRLFSHVLTSFILRFLHSPFGAWSHVFTAH